MAQLTAEETVLRDQVLLDPETTDEPGGPPLTDSGWMPTTVDPSDPRWADELTYQQHLHRS